MSETFKCDICGDYFDGRPYIVIILAYADSEVYDLCGNCILKIREIGLKRKLKFELQ